MGRPQLAINSGNCINGCVFPAHCRGLCRRCYRRDRYDSVERERRGASIAKVIELGSEKLNAQGYVLEYVGVPNANRHRFGWVLQHRKRMEEKIGRELVGTENVHHKNGLRWDNRIDNLELWVSSQPKGARVEDLIEYAKWVLDTYDH